MCTVAILPRPGGFVLGHNRDESVARARGIPPELRHVRGTAVLAPIDPDAGGTWVAVNDRGIAVCVLNAREPPERILPPEPYSRGLVALEAAAAPTVAKVARLLDPARLAAARAFDLVAVGPAAAIAAVHRWDGATLRVEPLAAPCMLASSLSDPVGASRERRRAWEGWLAGRTHPASEDLARWLASHDPEPGPRSVCFHRADARTVSRTVVSVGRDEVEVEYLDGQPCDPRAPLCRRVLQRAGAQLR